MHSRVRAPRCSLRHCLPPSPRCFLRFRSSQLRDTQPAYAPVQRFKCVLNGPPSHGSGSGWSLLLSCMTLSFTTSRRFIPTLSKLKHAPPMRRSRLEMAKLQGQGRKTPPSVRPVFPIYSPRRVFHEVSRAERPSQQARRPVLRSPYTFGARRASKVDVRAFRLLIGLLAVDR